MEENKQGYDPSEFEDDDYMTSQPVPEKSIRGYRIVIIILSVILVAISALYFGIHRQQMLDAELGRDRGGDELVGRGDDRHQIAAAGRIDRVLVGGGVATAQDHRLAAAEPRGGVAAICATFPAEHANTAAPG